MSFSESTFQRVSKKCTSYICFSDWEVEFEKNFYNSQHASTKRKMFHKQIQTRNVQIVHDVQTQKKTHTTKQPHNHTHQKTLQLRCVCKVKTKIPISIRQLIYSNSYILCKEFQVEQMTRMRHNPHRRLRAKSARQDTSSVCSSSIVRKEFRYLI